MTMLMALLLWSCTSDDITSPSGGRKGVSLAFNISTGRAGTRMSTDITHKNNSGFRDILSESLCLIPFEEKTIDSDANPLSAPLNQMTRYQDDKHPELIYYYDNGSLEIPDGTSSFLCYCKEQPLPKDLSATELDKFEYGALTTTVTTITNENWSGFQASDIKFDPVKIYQETEVVEDKTHVKAAAEATALASYLTAIANASSWSTYSQETAQGLNTELTLLRKLFRKFVNEGHPIACSSAYAAKWVNWLKTELNKEDYTSLVGDESNIRTAILTAISAFETAMTGEEAPTGYPANINLPEGAAVVQWNAKDKVFVPVVETTTIADVNSLNRFVYPPELYYYANSGIKTSPENLYEELKQKTWEEVLAKFDKGLGTVDGSVNSIAINDPLAYAVGNLQLGFYVPATSETNPSLQDAAGKPVELSSGTFPLQSILISSQHPQGFNFEPVKGTVDEFIAYDIKMKDKANPPQPIVVLGSSDTATPPDSKFTNTLVLQTKDGATVRFAMEFTNNSGDDFQGINGTVFNGTNFYLVGQIKVPIDQTEDYQKRVFTKNHITKGVVKISSLKEAYTYLPDLLDPSLEVGIQLVPDWVQSTSVSVPL